MQYLLDSEQKGSSPKWGRHDITEMLKYYSGNIKIHNTNKSLKE